VTVNPHLFPPLGFNFIDADRVIHEANSFEELVESLAKYRARAGQPAGNPRDEITEQLCRRHPHICFASAPPHIPPLPHDGKLLAARVVANTEKLLRSAPMAVVPDQYVEARVRQCNNCPANADWSEHCAPCQKRVAELLPRIIAPHQPESSLKGHACLCAQDDLSVAVKLQTPLQVVNAPGKCWRSME
jgi:hypothetical protein